MSGSVSGSTSHTRPVTVDNTGNTAAQTPPRSESPARQNPVAQQSRGALSGLSSMPGGTGTSGAPSRQRPGSGDDHGDTLPPLRRATLPPRTTAPLAQGAGAGGTGEGGDEIYEMREMERSRSGAAVSTHSFDVASDLEAGNGGPPQPTTGTAGRSRFFGGFPTPSMPSMPALPSFSAVFQSIPISAPSTQDLRRLMTAIGNLPQVASGAIQDTGRGIGQGMQRGYTATSEAVTAGLTTAQETLTPLALATQAHAGHIARNDYDGDHAGMGWVTNALHAGSHELVATGGATALRELVSAGIESALNKYDTSPEVKGMAVAVLFTMAAAGKVLALQHKRHKGVSTAMSNVGDSVQLMSLIGVGVGAVLTGRNQQGNGQLGVLSQLLPNAIKSFVYVVRDAINMAAPLEGNHDDGYERPVLTQALDSVPYLPNQFGVNEVQGFNGLSGAGAADLVHAGVKLGSAEAKELVAYVGANAAGEAVDAVGLRVASEVMTHGVTPKALEEVKSLRLKWTTMDTSTHSVQSQLADKMAGSGSARLALFLGIYGLNAIAASFLDKTSLSETDRAHAENALGALVVVAGCVPFAMATATKEAHQPVTV